VDRAALDAASLLGIPTRGWVPLGRLADDGRIPETYGGLQEAGSPDYAERTRRNVRDTDATLLLFRGALVGGSAYTGEEAERLGRPVLRVDLDSCPSDEAAGRIRSWLGGLSGSRLNVAGPRASQDPGIHGLAKALLLAVLGSAG
jgi:hypothetical protein